MKEDRSQQRSLRIYNNNRKQSNQLLSLSLSSGYNGSLYHSFQKIHSFENYQMYHLFQMYFFFFFHLHTDEKRSFKRLLSDGILVLHELYLPIDPSFQYTHLFTTFLSEKQLFPVVEMDRKYRGNGSSSFVITIFWMGGWQSRERSSILLKNKRKKSEFFLTKNSYTVPIKLDDELYLLSSDV